MLLELCDTTLKDWLSSHSTVTADMLEDILIFALNIARAVQFLHSQHVTFAILRKCYTCLLLKFAGGYADKLHDRSILRPGRGAEYCDQLVCLSVCLSASIYLEQLDRSL